MIISARRSSSESTEKIPTVVIVTTVGDIIVEVNVKQAPVSSESFLEHVDKGIFISAKGSFYRSVRPEYRGWSLIQGGLSFGDYKLPPIAHESTIQTGLSHTNGALSLARTNIGSASGGAFFICIGDQSSIFDEQGKVAEYGGDYDLGFAAFAKVIRGMNVVKKIHQMKLIPESDESSASSETIRNPPLILKCYRQ